MEFINLSHFHPALIVGKNNFPSHSLTLIVKGTFDLKPNEKAIVSEEQIFPTGDEFYPEDEDMVGGPKYASDFAYFKPRGDLLLTGKFHSPEGKKVYQSQVKFQAGNRIKTLNITGNRYWSGNTPTRPEAFSEMEVRYENSFGGGSYKKNPVGKGIDKEELKTGDKLIPLPNILHIGESISSPATKLEPAGFGALGQTWIQRFSKLGSYKGNYLKERWPWFSKDFDWSFFNSAPLDMQVPGYLKGDEKLYFENLHPNYSKYYSQLPGLRVRCFIDELDKAQKNFKEVKMNLDTLCVDMETEKLILVWRGVSEIKSEDYEEIQNIFIASEKLDEQLRVVEYYKTLLHEEIAEPEEEKVFEPEPSETVNEEDIEMEKEIARAEEQMRASLIDAGIDPDNLPQPTEEDKKKEAEILKGLGFEDEAEQIPLTREIFIERAGRKESFQGEDLSGMDLSELTLQSLNFKNANLSNASFKNSDLSDSDLTEANLSNADLSSAKLNDAVLKDSDLSAAILTKSDLTKADIEGAIFEKAKINNAILNEVKGKNSFFSEADLTGTIFIESDFEGADFSKSIVDNTTFKNSNLSEASFEGSSCIKINMSGSILNGMKASNGNFLNGSFKKCKGLESIWANANLTEADFSFSEMEGANFSNAFLQKTNLYAADMKFAKFTKADLTNAIVKDMNLFQGILEKADLTNADCSGSNFYGVEFLNSILKNTNFFSTNLKMTKLSK